MTVREIDLVGSVPAESAEDAIAWALDELGDFLRAVPDGETGDRDTWVVSQDARLRDNPALILTKDRDWSDYKNIPKYEVKSGRLLPSDLSLDYAKHALPAAVLLSRLSSVQGKDLKVGIVSPLDFAVFNFSLRDARRYVDAVHRATSQEITKIYFELSDRVVFQIEIPVETVFAVKADHLPWPVRRLLHRRLARSVHRLVRMCSPGARFSVHLCFGRLGGVPLAVSHSARPAAELAEAVLDGWPMGYPLVQLHLPLCGVSAIPSADPAFYAPLAGLSGAGPRIAAGFVHCGASLEDQQHTLERVEGVLGERVSVSSSCGMGHMSMLDATLVAERSRLLAAL